MQIWSIFWCLVCIFWPILKWIFCTFLTRVLLTQSINFYSVKMDTKTYIFIRYTLEENKINTSFKIGQKQHTKHHQIDQKTWKFDRFDDVWYAVFFQFWNFSLSYFLQGYGEQTFLMKNSLKTIKKCSYSLWRILVTFLLIPGVFFYQFDDVW